LEYLTSPEATLTATAEAEFLKCRGARPHELLFHPEVLEKRCLPTILVETIEHQLK